MHPRAGVSVNELVALKPAEHAAQRREQRPRSSGSYTAGLLNHIPNLMTIDGLDRLSGPPLRKTPFDQSAIIIKAEQSSCLAPPAGFGLRVFFNKSATRSGEGVRIAIFDFSAGTMLTGLMLGYRVTALLALALHLAASWRAPASVRGSPITGVPGVSSPL